MKLLRFVAVVLVLVGAAWVVYGISELRHLSAPAVLGFGSEFTGNAQLPVETITQAFDNARDRMLATNSAGTRFRITADVSAWLSFFASAMVTIILGWFGYAPKNGVALPGQQSPAPLSRSAMRWIGALAAFAAASTALGTLAESYAQRQYSRSDDIQKLLIESRREVLNAHSVEDARAVLDNLESKSSRL